MEIEEGEPYVEPGATAEDDVDGTVEVTIEGSVGAAPGEYVLTYSASDSAGNLSSVERIVIVMAASEEGILGKSPEEILETLSLRQKAAQLIQAEISHISLEDIRQYGIGSVLNGGGSYPDGDRAATVEEWRQYSALLREASLDTTQGSAGIPIVWGTDAVHGHNNVRGAVLYPHNIGLGATNDPGLLRAIGAATADAVAATGIDWVFGPTVAQDGFSLGSHFKAIATTLNWSVISPSALLTGFKAGASQRQRSTLSVTAAPSAGLIRATHRSRMQNY